MLGLRYLVGRRILAFFNPLHACSVSPPLFPDHNTSALQTAYYRQKARAKTLERQVASLTERLEDATEAASDLGRENVRLQRALECEEDK